LRNKGFDFISIPGRDRIAQLARLAKRYGVTQRQMIEKLVIAADDEITKNMDIDTKEWEEYFSVTA
jgi:hypothetical protein